MPALGLLNQLQKGRLQKQRSSRQLSRLREHTFSTYNYTTSTPNTAHQGNTPLPVLTATTEGYPGSFSFV